jgi:beta-aspartyl-peptidase (threonine type)
MDIGGLTLQDAAQRVVHHELPQLNGLGGLIAVDGFGRVAMPFNTAGMFRAHQCQDDAPKVGIW